MMDQKLTYQPFHVKDLDTFLLLAHYANARSCASTFTNPEAG
jgi:hypothetical protein